MEEKVLKGKIDELAQRMYDLKEKELRAKVEAGEMTPDEAEHEFRETYDPEPRYCGREW